MKRFLILALDVCLPLLLLAALARAQTGAGAAGVGTIRGAVTDPTGASIPGASVTATGPVVNVAETGAEGKYAINGLPPGVYRISVLATGFTVFDKPAVKVAAGQVLTLDARLVVAAAKQEVTVTDQVHVDVEPSNNGSQLVLKGADLDALSDNPDDLASDLQALAGPSAGPNGGQIFIDGFTGGRLPPKESIREVRINQNPFSAEYDRLGFGRIEIFTKPGTDKYHGQAFFNFGDAIFNSRNPYSLTRPPYQQKFFGGNFSGPLGKKASFFIDAERRDQDETSIINAVALDPSFNVTRYNNAVLSPNVRTTVSPRIDYQLTPNNTLVARYTFAKVDQENQGLDAFSLPSRAYGVANTEHTAQVTETAVLNAHAINETRFQYIGRRNNQSGDNSTPGVQVLDSFTGGGSSIGLAYSNEDRYELQNNTSLTLNKHVLRFGGRVRGVHQSDYSTQNYNGTFTFTSIGAYSITQQGLANGWTPEQIRAAGGGASQFSVIGGTPLAAVSQYDLGLFAQDDWRVRPNFTLSLGLRFENQDNISNKANFAPRVGIAWGLDGGKSRQAKTVLRAGVGLFYDRFSEDLTLQARRLNGVTQLQYLVPSPDFYPNVPPLSALEANRQPLTIRQVDASLHAPYVAQSALGIDRQLPKNITVSVTWASTRGVHQLRSRNINAPLPDSGLLPYPGAGNLYLYESTGLFRQNQILSNVNARINPKLNLFGFYVFGKANGNTNGAASFPANQYDLTSEYGRSAFDVRHRVFIGGSLTGPRGIRLSPFMVASTGTPFNITVGRDLNHDSLFTDRPAFATDLSRPSVVSTPYGVFDLNPVAGETIIPLNYGDGPGQFSFNLRMSKTWGFGEKTEATARPDGGEPRRGPMGGGPRGGPGGGGMRGGFGGGGGRGGPGGMFGDSSTGKHYNLTLSISARNLLNHVNPGPPIGNLSSSLFGTSNGLAGGFFATPTANRRLEFQLRLSF